MSKRKYPGEKPRSVPPTFAQKTGEAPPSGAGHSHLPSSAAVRETIESVVIAFVLAFLFRTFEAEAFVIPTGSMAPTLMGRHKDVVCPICGSPYQASASEELKPDGSPQRYPDGREYRVEAATCPMCRHTNPMEKDPSYNGDRILVSKFAYEFSDPKRWDIIVFKFPGDGETDSQTNFIKRLIGLPGETVRIQHGDIWICHDDKNNKDDKSSKDDKDKPDFQIERKPPEKLLAMLQPVFDNDYMPKIAEFGWPQRWTPESATEGAWRAGDAASFTTDGSAKGPAWLRYRHRVPSNRQWQDVDPANPKESRIPKVEPQLITDFTAYDTSQLRAGAHDMDTMGVNWVGDLAVACTVNVESSSGELAFELRKGGRQFQCCFDLATGRATLSISGSDKEKWRPSAVTSVRGPGRHEILFSNCDDELRLWVDGAVVAFDAPTAYDDLGNDKPNDSDLSPVGIASTGAAVRISHLKILRDIYYGAMCGGSGTHTEIRDVRYMAGRALPGEDQTPRGCEYVDFPLAPDRFFALGDNSEKSKDGRLWGANNYWVPRELLIGKALFIYWPHPWNRIPYIGVPCPYFPNFGRMELVR